MLLFKHLCYLKLQWDAVACNMVLNNMCVQILLLAFVSTQTSPGIMGSG